MSIILSTNKKIGFYFYFLYVKKLAQVRFRKEKNTKKTFFALLFHFILSVNFKLASYYTAES